MHDYDRYLYSGNSCLGAFFSIDRMRWEKMRSNTRTHDPTSKTGDPKLKYSKVIHSDYYAHHMQIY